MVARKLFSAVLMCCVVLGLFAAPAFSNDALVKAQEVQPPDSPTQEPGLAPVLASGPSATVVPDQYIVVYKAGSHSKDNVQHGANNAKAKGGNVKHVFSSALHGFSAQLPAAALGALRRDPNVEYIAPDEVVTINGDTMVPSVESSATWGLDRVDQRARPLDGQYHYLYNGTGVNVYVIDTGIRVTHTEFGGRAAWGINEVADGNNTDCNGHGTHVAGTIGGSTYGVAKGAKLIAVKVMKCDGTGDWSAVIAGIDWVTAHHVSPAVANMSLGGGAYAPLDTAINNSIAAGVTYVVAAGNNGDNACLTSPSRVPNAITVGATDSFDWRAYFSNYGTCVDLFAPGDIITSAWNSSDTSTNTLSGTSMASPHVAGAAALFLQTHPAATPATVASALVNQATTGRLGDVGTGSPNRLLYVLGPASTPLLISPANNAFANNPKPTLTWKASINGSKYRVQIATAATFGTSVVRDSQLIGALSFTPGTALPNGKYYWHIRAFNVAGQAGPWSVYRAFTVDTVPPAKPLLSSPASGATVSGNPIFSWLATAGANAYQFQYTGQGDTAFGAPVFTSAALGRLSYQPPTMNTGTYLWRVRARDAAGNWGCWSVARLITIH